MNLRPSGHAAAGAGAVDNKLAPEVVGARVHIDVTIPQTSVVGKMRVLSYGEERVVDAESRIATRAVGITENIEASRAYREEVAARTVAIAVRDPANVDMTLASFEAWRQCDSGQIGALWQDYKDLAERLDPIGSGAVSESDLQVMEAAAKKGDAGLLMSFGSSRLAGFAIILAGRLST